MIIGIAGPSASGKTTVAKLLEKERGALRIRYSSILSEMARERGLDIEDKAVLQKMFVDEREKRGESFLADELINRVSLLHPRFLVIEGNRRLVDIEGLNKLAKTRREPLLLIYIDASPEIRFTRYNRHPEEHGYKAVTQKEFEELEKNPAEDELPKLRELIQKEGLYIDTGNCDENETIRRVFEAVDKIN